MTGRLRPTKKTRAEKPAFFVQLPDYLPRSTELPLIDLTGGPPG